MTATALALWQSLLGDRVTAHPASLRNLGLNLTEYQPREMSALLSPIDREEVMEIVAIAHREKIPLYPLSTGRNWGLGSKLPVRSGGAWLDLSGLKRILQVDEGNQFTVVEPGVTQGQLSERLLKTPLMANVTGSGEHTSILGNLLERGVGMLGSRASEIRGLEILTARGEIIRCGLERFGDQARHHPLGLGPDLTGLFLQSNLGIVLSAAVTLYPREAVDLALIQMSDEQLPACLDILANLRRQGILRDRIEIDSDNDPRLEGVADRTCGRHWWGWLALWGEKDIRELFGRKLREKLAGACKKLTFFRSEEDNPEPVHERFLRLRGIPGNFSIDAMARASDVSVGHNLDIDLEESIPGFVCALPAVPFHGRGVQAALRAVIGVSEGLPVFLSFNSISPYCLEGYIRFVFDRRNPEQVRQAHQWEQQVHQALIAEGLYPLRLSVEMMGQFFNEGDSYEKTLSNIKSLMDPNHILAPGRYCP